VALLRSKYHTDRIQFPSKPCPWPADDLRRASVNSFGFGGSNAHVILDDAYNALRELDLTAPHCTQMIPPRDLDDASSTDSAVGLSVGSPYDRLYTGSSSGREKLFVWSATESKGIERWREAYDQYLRKNLPELRPDFLLNLSYTLAEKRNHLPWRTYVVASSIEQLNGSVHGGFTPPVRSSRQPRLGFIFTGQGAQWYAMGRELMNFLVFKAILETADESYRKLGATWSLLGKGSLLPGKKMTAMI
jgi:acyl transferase domain-containing protein